MSYRSVPNNNTFLTLKGIVHAQTIQISSAPAVDWYNFVRDVCIQCFLDHPMVIGSPGKEVEI